MCMHASCILVMITLLCLGVYHLIVIKAKKSYTMLCSWGGGVSFCAYSLSSVTG